MCESESVERKAPHWNEISALQNRDPPAISQLDLSDEPYFIQCFSPPVLCIVTRVFPSWSLAVPVELNESVDRACLGKTIVAACRERGIDLRVGALIRCRVQSAGDVAGVFTHYVNEVVESPEAGIPIHVNNHILEAELECDASVEGALERGLEENNEYLIAHCRDGISVCMPAHRLTPSLSPALTMPDRLRFRAVLMAKRAGCHFRLLDTAPIYKGSGQQVLPVNQKPKNNKKKYWQEDSGDEDSGAAAMEAACASVLVASPTVADDGKRATPTVPREVVSSTTEELTLESAMGRLLSSDKFVENLMAEGFEEHVEVIRMASERESEMKHTNKESAVGDATTKETTSDAGGTKNKHIDKIPEQPGKKMGIVETKKEEGMNIEQAVERLLANYEFRNIIAEEGLTKQLHVLLRNPDWKW